MQMRLGGEQDSTQSDKTMTDRYRCGPDSNWTQTDRKMVDQYGCGPNSNWHDEWSIDMDAVPTQTKPKLTRWMTDRYRCGPKL